MSLLIIHPVEKPYCVNGGHDHKEGYIPRLRRGFFGLEADLVIAGGHIGRIDLQEDAAGVLEGDRREGRNGAGRERCRVDAEADASGGGEVIEKIDGHHIFGDLALYHVDIIIQDVHRVIRRGYLEGKIDVAFHIIRHDAYPAASHRVVDGYGNGCVRPGIDNYAVGAIADEDGALKGTEILAVMVMLVP
ncbi:MAG: hypothetical protein M0P57_07865 [Syntrophales bacterium]|nr:hypothetical protein [Syntrophales bacterium]